MMAMSICRRSPISSIVDGAIAAVRPGIGRAIAQGEAVAELGARSIDQTIDASDKLVMPGFVNAHYHSHDVLLKGCFETIPLELWLLSALPPSYPKRSTAEIRARTFLGAFECLRSGMTTVQDLCTIYPFDEEHLEAILKAYEDVGIRCVFALQFADMAGAKSIPFWEELVPPAQRRGAGRVGRAVPGDRSAAAPARGLDLAAQPPSAPDIRARPDQPGTMHARHHDQARRAVGRGEAPGLHPRL